MPHARELLLQGSAIACEQLTLLQAAPGWSDEYRVASSRLVLPSQGPLACRIGPREWRCDPAVGLWLAPDAPYRMRLPRAGQRSLVIAVPSLQLHAGRVNVTPAVWLALRSWCSGVHAADPLAAEETLVRTVAPLVPAAAAPWQGGTPAVERALAHLAEHFTRNDTLAQIGQAAASSPFHLARAFRRVTGTSLHGHRTRLRITEALRRLDGGADDLAALALDLGFCSHGHFTQVFRRACGATPRQVRTNLAALRRRMEDTSRRWQLPSSASSQARRRR